MGSIGSKLQKQGVIMALLSLVLMNASCDERIDSPAVNPSDGKTIEVSLNIGFADEADAATLGGGTATKGTAFSNGHEALEVQLVSCELSKATEGVTMAHPDQLYNLEICQYNAAGTRLNTDQGTITNYTPGTALNVTLSDNSGQESQLLIIARGANQAVEALGTKSLTAVQEVIANAAQMKAIATNGSSNINDMPYLLFLPKVKISSDGKLQDPSDTDIRLLLKRLAVGLTIDWTFSQVMKENGYILTEVRLMQIPADYRILPKTETEALYGEMYPTSVSEFVDGFRLKGDDLTKAGGTQTQWIPANARGTRTDVTAVGYRNKNYAHSAATYVEFVVDNTSKGERLFYRVYLGGNATTDFNLFENTNYHWVVNINNANYTSDNRIQLLDQTPVTSDNLQSTSNCFMMRPGTNICFNPYKHEAGTGGWNTYLTSGGSIATGKEITSVKVLWQTKDAGTGGDLVMGYEKSKDDHTNLVRLAEEGNVTNARIHVNVPVTKGGNAVIAAYNGSTIVWSWHIWVTDYVPVRISNFSEYKVAQEKTQNGTVHKYRSALFQSAGKYADCVMMDRDIGALAGGYPTIYKGAGYSVYDNVRTQGLLYQGTRKDPFFVSADGTTNEINTIFNGDGYSLGVTNVDEGKDYEYSIRNPLHYVKGLKGIGLGQNSWDNNGEKTVDDPCPEGWKVPLFDHGSTEADFSGTIFDGFQADRPLVDEDGATYIIKNQEEFKYSSYQYGNILYDVAVSGSENPKGGRLFYLGDNKSVEKTIHNTVWFPVSAERVYTTAALNAPMFAHIWFANKSNNSGFMLGSGMKPNAVRVVRYGMGYAWPVRCIQYNK